ncbi:hypothetical protein CYMTET_17072 [Cymbomonas tetramitiformis]|uniref:Uncharacterized protein n=1 Tax=Cymbomonas tetramitiformis TaxID=36881 RepID=A0AAE0GB01_9CHLO|nr:hypothetical protein CYMTET_17072 [Cymbomonas tetramitiformis]
MSQEQYYAWQDRVILPFIYLIVNTTRKQAKPKEQVEVSLSGMSIFQKTVTPFVTADSATNFVKTRRWATRILFLLITSRSYPSPFLSLRSKYENAIQYSRPSGSTARHFYPGGSISDRIGRPFFVIATCERAMSAWLESQQREKWSDAENQAL